MALTVFTTQHLTQLHQAHPGSHKGNNGKLLVIGGSQLFHASIFWSADVASKVVDLVHFSSPASENNDLVRYKAKEKFWNGIVVDWDHVESYIQEDDCILIGPGMPRPDGLGIGEKPTAQIVNELLVKYPHKKWVIDGGALQECDINLLTESMIVTPHLGEFRRILDKVDPSEALTQEFENLLSQKDIEAIGDFCKVLSQKLGCTILLKGIESQDIVCQGATLFNIEGGNEGLTKGGTGDVLAGLVAAWYCTNAPVVSGAASSLFLKTSADALYEHKGPYYTTTELVDQIGHTMGALLKQSS